MRRELTYDEFISRPRRLWSRVLHRRDEIMKLESVCMIPTSEPKERVQYGTVNATESNYVALIDLKSRLDDLIQDHRESASELREFLHENLDFNEADMLEWRYIDGKSPKDIATIMGIAEQTVRNNLSKYNKKCREKYIEYKKV